MWDRSKQNYWILRRGDPWKVINSKTDETVCEYPACYYDSEVTKQICFAKDDEEVKKLVEQIK